HDRDADRVTRTSLAAFAALDGDLGAGVRIRETGVDERLQLDGGDVEVLLAVRRAGRVRGQLARGQIPGPLERDAVPALLTAERLVGAVRGAGGRIDLLIGPEADRRVAREDDDVGVERAGDGLRSEGPVRPVRVTEVHDLGHAQGRVEVRIDVAGVRHARLED